MADPLDQQSALSISALYEVGRRLASTEDLGTLLSQIAEVTKRLVDYQTFAVFLLDPDGKHLIPRYALGFRELYVETVRIRVGDGLVGQAAQRQELIWIPDVGQEPRYVRRISESGEEVRSELIIPLIYEGQTVGVMDVGSTRPAQFSEEELAFLRTLGTQVAIGVAKARLREAADRLHQENLELRRAVEGKYTFGEIVGRGPAMARVLQLVEKVIPSNSTVLIEGETGTGKELLARAIHYNGPRRDRRFLAQNCAALSETLLESELFGHRKGAFTGAISDKKGLFELADGGTVFLDEVGDMSVTMQAKILRVLQEGEIRRVGAAESQKVDFRLIAATNKDLDAEVGGGRFRQDLYFRLRVFPIRVPPLRERREDIPALVQHFLNRFARELGKDIASINAPALDLLAAYPFPGNVRELENELERAAIMVEPDGCITPGMLSDRIWGVSPEGGPEEHEGRLKNAVETLEQELIQEALTRHAGNVSEAARALGISRQWLIKKMTRYKMRHPKVSS
ncbi:MAG: sigma 54-interacting transcriptional regulator [Candidatus Methylomirabilales bacterium]